MATMAMTVAASAAGKRLLLTPLPIQSGSSANPSHPARQASAATGAAESAATSQQNRLAGARHGPRAIGALRKRSEEHTSELQSLMRISYAVFCLKKQNPITHN